MRSVWPLILAAFIPKICPVGSQSLLCDSVSRPRMYFSMSCGLSFMCVTMLLFLPAQGQLQHATPEPPNMPPVSPPCCMEVSQAHIRETVDACFEQMEGRIPYCKIHAYIFVTVSKELCVDPGASWLPERLHKLQERGIFCKIL